MKVAVIDLGTNTFNLLIANFESQKLDLIFYDKIPVEIGRNGINNRIIMPEAYSRAISAMMLYSEKIKNFCPEKIYAFATSAIRNAGNGKQLTADIFARTGIRVNIIDGSEEARLIYLGVRQTGVLQSDNVLIMDVGGGSCEFIIANDERIAWRQSFEIGVARILDRFKSSDPITRNELYKLTNYFANVLQPLATAVASYPVSTLVGSSGSFDTIVDMISQYLMLDNSDKSRLFHKIESNHLELLSDRLMVSTREERSRMKGLPYYRVDYIVIAAVLIGEVLRISNISHIYQSAFALKEGIIYNVCNNN